jgi:hypothetical protein
MKKIVLSFGILTIALFAVTAMAAASNKSPTSCAGNWYSCSGAFNYYGSYAYARNPSVSGTWSGFTFGLPSSATIQSITVNAMSWASRTSGYFDIQVSNDGGTTWGAVHRIGGNTASAWYNIDVTSDFAWAPSGLDASNYKIKVTSVSLSNSSTTWYLDYLATYVVYTYPQPDLTLTSSDVAFDPAPVALNGSTQITAVIHNNGQVDAGPYKVGFYDASVQQVLIGYVDIAGTPAGGVSNAVISYNTVPLPVGSHRIYVSADDYGSVAESNENNNFVNTTLSVI